MLSLNYQHSHNTLFSLHYIKSDEFNLFVEPGEEHNDAALLYGYIFKKKWFNLSTSAGIGAFWGKHRTNLSYSESNFLGTDYYNSKNFMTPAVPLKIGAFFTFTPYTGIGFEYNVNLNLVRINYTAFLCAQIGFIR